MEDTYINKVLNYVTENQDNIVNDYLKDKEYINKASFNYGYIFCLLQINSIIETKLGLEIGVLESKIQELV
ncbi:MAG: hypothetical protein E6R13_06950 [Spirochaetes bacterium]|nr:MAG: hypothetical protein E6R13_06950 [Spirochaetota bacterium]